MAEALASPLVPPRATGSAVLARKALEVTVRNEADLLALLPPVSPATSRSQHAVAMSALPRTADISGPADHVR